YFFFQAEDGIRDRNVTGVQTCALPIYRARSARTPRTTTTARGRSTTTLGGHGRSESYRNGPNRLAPARRVTSPSADRPPPAAWGGRCGHGAAVGRPSR